MEKETATQSQVEEPQTVLATSEKVAVFEHTQHEQTRLQAIKENWKGVLWCIYSFFICKPSFRATTNDIS
jgi:hypothetical protein